MEIARRVWARQNRSDVESELRSEDPTEVGDDVIFSEEEEDWEVVVTSMEHCDPMAMSAGGEQEVERRGDVPAPRKRAMSADAIGEQEVKRTWSPCPSVASPALSPPTSGVAEQARRLEEWVCTHASLGLVSVCDSQLRGAPPATLVGAPRADGRGDAWAE